MKIATSRTSVVPKGWHTITPRIVARDAKRLVGFLKQVFGAKGRYRHERPSEIRIGDSMLMITDTGVRDATPAFLYVYVPNVDATYRRAVKAGGRAIERPSDMAYGDRRCMIVDRWQNVWQIATPQRAAAASRKAARPAAKAAPRRTPRRTAAADSD